jgi:hypothetical protein
MDIHKGQKYTSGNVVIKIFDMDSALVWYHFENAGVFSNWDMYETIADFTKFVENGDLKLTK